MHLTPSNMLKLDESVQVARIQNSYDPFNLTCVSTLQLQGHYIIICTMWMDINNISTKD